MTPPPSPPAPPPANLSWLHKLAGLRHTPALTIVQKVLARVPHTPVQITQFFFLRHDGIPALRGAQRRGPGVVRRATVDDLPALTMLTDKHEKFLERFAAGDRCVIATVDGRAVGYEWFCDRPTHRESVWGYPIRIPEGSVYAYDAYIDPGYRNSGLWLRFKDHLATLMRETGKTSVLTFVEHGNWSSLKAHLRLGFKPARDVFVLRVLGRTVWKELRRRRLELSSVKW